MKKLYLSLALIAIAGMMSCNEDNGCNEIWYVEQSDPTSIIEVDEQNEALSLQMTNFAGVGDVRGIAAEVYQSYFDGNFYTATAQFESFLAPVGGSNGRGYVEMVMYDTNYPDTVADTTIMRVGISSTHIYAAIGPVNMVMKPRLSTTTSGSFNISKQGSQLSAWCIAGNDTARVTRTAVFNPVNFGFRIGSINDSAVTGTVGIKIPQLSVPGTSGTTLYGDDFTCNSLMY